MRLFDLLGAEEFEAPEGGWGADAEAKLAALWRQNKVLRANLERSMMISHALWEIVRFQCGLTDEDILRKISEVDLRDGVLDGKNHGRATTCTGCGQRISTRNAACPYCGKATGNAGTGGI